MNGRWRSGCLALLLAAGPVAASADDHERVREWVEQGRILPLSRLLESLPEGLDGRLLVVELESEHGRPVYEVEWLTPAGRVLEFRIDAVDGTLLSRGDDRGRHRRRDRER